jgi:hypothetical protein
MFHGVSVATLMFRECFDFFSPMHCRARQSEILRHIDGRNFALTP